MKNPIFVVTALAVSLALASAGAALADKVQRQITVTGEGRVETVPDMATITLGVTNQAAEAGDAMAATSDAVARILDRLETAGIAPRDMQTRRLTLNPIWADRGRPGRERPGIAGFVASNTVFVRVRDLTELGAILDAVIADGANDFNGLEFGVQEPRPLADEARRRAVEDAMAKAQLLAGAAGVSLGPVLSMSEPGGRPGPMRMEMDAVRSVSVPVAAGEVSISAVVSMVFAIAE